MNMEMTLREKIKIVVGVIDEARAIQKTNPVYVLIDYFSQSNLGFPNVRDVFRVLQENGAIKKLRSSWVYEAIGKDGVRTFVKTGDEQTSAEDFEAYEVEFDKTKWENAKKLTTGEVKTVVILDDLIFNEDGLLYSENNPEVNTPFGKDTGRYRMLNALIDANGAYVLTEILRVEGGKESNRLVQKEMGAIKIRIAKLLSIKKPAKDTIIQGEGYSGYRLLVKIRKSK